MKLNEGEGRLGNGAVMMILIAEDADAGRDFHLSVVGIGDVLQEEDFG
jgi:hypothetical protein